MRTSRDASTIGRIFSWSSCEKKVQPAREGEKKKEKEVTAEASRPMVERSTKSARESERETERRSGARGRMVRGDMGVPRVESNARAHAGGLARRLACIDQRAWQPRSVTAGAFGTRSLSLVPSTSKRLVREYFVSPTHDVVHIHIYARALARERERERERSHNRVAPVCDRRHYARGIPTFRRCAMCRSSSPRKARSVSTDRYASTRLDRRVPRTLEKEMTLLSLAARERRDNSSRVARIVTSPRFSGSWKFCAKSRIVVLDSSTPDVAKDISHRSTTNPDPVIEAYSGRRCPRSLGKISIDRRCDAFRRNLPSAATAKIHDRVNAESADNPPVYREKNRYVHAYQDMPF